MVDGIAAGVAGGGGAGGGCVEEEEEGFISPLEEKAKHRVGLLKGYGNAIVAPQAQIFVETVMELTQQPKPTMQMMSDTGYEPIEDTIFAIDFETYYSAAVSITVQGTHNYLRHPECDIYLVSIVGNKGFEWVGHPHVAPWHLLDGKIWVSHNASFDSQLYDAWVDGGQTTEGACRPSAWYCTANMAAFLGAPRSLAGAARQLLGEVADKTVRGNMKGKRFEDLPADDEARDALEIGDIPGGWQGKRPWKTITDKRRAGIPTVGELREYALDDSRLCLRLLMDCGGGLPQWEWRASEHTVMMTARGIGVNPERLDAAVNELVELEAAALKELPWATEDCPPLSPKRLARECDTAGIPAPVTTNKNDSRFFEWLDAWEAEAPFVKAFGAYRSVSKALATAQAMLARVDNGRLYYDMKYCGAHTHRFSGGGGLNVQNWPRPDTVAKLGIPDLRSIMEPAPGKIFVVADFAQVEARILLWVAGAFSKLRPIAGGMCVYEAYAREALGYTDARPLKEVDNELRKFSKVCVLGCGYQAGPARFRDFAKTGYGLVMTDEEAGAAVGKFRLANPEIMALWGRLQSDFESSCRKSPGEEYSITLPSKNELRYFNAQTRTDYLTRPPSTDYVASVEMGRGGTKLYGGVLTNNLCQSIGRDLLVLATLRLEAAGYPVVLHVHDEVVIELDDPGEVGRGEVVSEVERIMCEAPEWAAGLPIAAEASVMERYGK